MDGTFLSGPGTPCDLRQNEQADWRTTPADPLPFLRELLRLSELPMQGRRRHDTDAEFPSSPAEGGFGVDSRGRPGPQVPQARGLALTICLLLGVRAPPMSRIGWVLRGASTIPLQHSSSPGPQAPQARGLALAICLLRWSTSAQSAPTGSTSMAPSLIASGGFARTLYDPVAWIQVGQPQQPKQRWTTAPRDATLSHCLASFGKQLAKETTRRAAQHARTATRRRMDGCTGAGILRSVLHFNG
jgi:hypothetical protein